MRKIIMGIIASQLFYGCVPVVVPMMEDSMEGRKVIDTGTAALRQGKFDEAAAAFELASDLGAKTAAFDGLGCVAFLRGDNGLAESFFLKAIESNPNYSTALGNLAYLYEAEGNSELAEKYYNRALIQDPSSVKVRNNYAGFLLDRYGESGASQAKIELLKAHSLVTHPIVEMNLSKMEQ